MEDLSWLSSQGASIVCLVPGNYGRRMALILGVPDAMIVNIGNFVGDSLTMAGNLGFDKLILIGQIGKFSRVAAGSLDTHNSRSDGRLEALAAYAALHGADREAVGDILACKIVDEVAAKITRMSWGREALSELVNRVSEIASSIAAGISECACLTFSLPDRELSRTSNLGGLIEEIKMNSGNLR
jgi:cobalt-precorrin-5B (C1)-methyltransferase